MGLLNQVVVARHSRIDGEPVVHPDSVSVHEGGFALLEYIVREGGAVLARVDVGDPRIGEPAQIDQFQA